MMISFYSEKQKCWKLPEIVDKIILHPYLHRKRSAKPEAVIESLLQWRWWEDLSVAATSVSSLEEKKIHPEEFIVEHYWNIYLKHCIARKVVNVKKMHLW